jgi:hypothetical protein
MGQNKQQQQNKKMDKLRLFTLKYDLLKIFVDLQTVFAGYIYAYI